MPPDFNEITTHDSTEHCIACRAQEVVDQSLLPAAEAWEAAAGLPRFAVALHGAAGLIGRMLENGVSRADAEGALAVLLDDIEQQLSEDKAMGGPAQGSA